MIAPPRHIEHRAGGVTWRYPDKSEPRANERLPHFLLLSISFVFDYNDSAFVPLMASRIMALWFVAALHEFEIIPCYTLQRTLCQLATPLPIILLGFQGCTGAGIISDVGAVLL